jgi:hypothetical protein
MNKVFEERPTDGMPDMMPKGTVDNPPQKEPQNIPVRMKEQPYDPSGKEYEEKGEKIDDVSKSRMDEKISDWGETECEC